MYLHMNSEGIRVCCSIWGCLQSQLLVFKSCVRESMAESIKLRFLQIPATEVRQIAVCLGPTCHAVNSQQAGSLTRRHHQWHQWQMRCDGIACHVPFFMLATMKIKAGMSRYHISSLLQHSTAQHSTAQHSTAQHSTAQHSAAQHLVQ